MSKTARLLFDRGRQPSHSRAQHVARLLLFLPQMPTQLRSSTLNQTILRTSLRRADHFMGIVVLFVGLLGAVGFPICVWSSGIASNSFTPFQYAHCVSVSIFILITP